MCACSKARYDQNGIGTIGDYAIFSFQAIKHMTTVDGGILTTRDSSNVARARKLRWFGLAKGVPRTDVDIQELGFKYNMNNVSAVIGLAQPIKLLHLLASILRMDDSMTRN